MAVISAAILVFVCLFGQAESQTTAKIAVSTRKVELLSTTTAKIAQAFTTAAPTTLKAAVEVNTTKFTDEVNTTKKVEAAATTTSRVPVLTTKKVEVAATTIASATTTRKIVEAPTTVKVEVASTKKAESATTAKVEATTVAGATTRKVGAATTAKAEVATTKKVEATTVPAATTKRVEAVAATTARAALAGATPTTVKSEAAVTTKRIEAATTAKVEAVVTTRKVEPTTVAAATTKKVEAATTKKVEAATTAAATTKKAEVTTAKIVAATTKKAEVTTAKIVAATTKIAIGVTTKKPEVTTTKAAVPTTAGPATTRKIASLAGENEAAVIGSCSKNADCAQNEECVGFPIWAGGPKCQCKAGFRVSNVTCTPVVNLKIGDKCNSSSIELLPQHTICKNSIVSCNAFYKQTVAGCTKISQGSFGSACGAAQQKCIVGETATLWCDRTRKQCRCYESDAYRFSDNSDLCVRREFGDACISDSECSVYGDVAAGGYTYGGGICVKNNASDSNGTCGCSSKYVVASFTAFHADENTIRSRFICVHKSSVLNVALGQSCTLDPIYYGDNPLGQTRVCQSGNVCVRSTQASPLLPRRYGVCTSLRN